MRIPIFEFAFKFSYQKNVTGDTIWQRLKNIFFGRYIYNKNSSGDFVHFYFTLWDIKMIKVYLPTLPDGVKGSKNIFINDIRTNYEDLNNKTKELLYELILAQIITHEYLHYVFADLNLELTGKQQHRAIGKLGIWTNEVKDELY